jgi:hypothetical protein
MPTGTTHMNNIIQAQADIAPRTERQSSAWDYQVESIPLLTPEGNPSGFFGNRRTDTGKVLGAVSERYGILQNRDVFQQAEEVFSKMGIKTGQNKHIVTRDGSQARAIYTIEDQGVTIRSKDDLLLRLTIGNSFDGSLGAYFEVGYVRLVCTNGLLAPMGRGISFAKKHTSSIGLTINEATVKSAIASFQQGATVFKQFADRNVTQREGLNALGNMAQKKVISLRMAEQIAQVWNSPTYSRDNDRNVWSLYNSATEHLTHEVAPKRFELAQRSTQGIANALGRFVQKNDTSLIAYPSSDYILN